MGALAAVAAWEGAANNPIVEAAIVAQVRAFPRRLCMPVIPSDCGRGKPRKVMQGLPYDPEFRLDITR
jgi:hypothetical protein